ncbi:GNAT family N-acetyltransferase [Aspergillus homomorphus CBS 101889]|uniref:Acyl-CoA N-acyltransferase n=1 Tax=Aspergillus homomorphus (strain CBS 101889) TaxID=1450537 RepID=A0A395I4Q6_ASPHC|nr:acyl-CoA N-acyltransferase [Aspergillus homomorphus CBS 101889]RAL13354.1 acyl-CoA N-acyltransferase [Aspergillus homomorphus CBS 101889]
MAPYEPPPTASFHSARLLYRAPEDNEEDRAFLQHAILNDSTIQAVSTSRLRRPLPQRSAEEFIKALQSSLLGVIICLPPPQTTPKPIPIGHLGFFNTWGANVEHNRNTMLGISLAEPYRGKGYGAEAINWGLDWAFLHAGLHRVSLNAFAYNERAVRLYRRLGFVEEGREREALLHMRRWHDVINFSMLEGEWARLRGWME